MKKVDLKNYPINIRDLKISDPYILADDDTGMYYVHHCCRESCFEEHEKHLGRTMGALSGDQSGGVKLYAHESPDLIHWSRPILCYTPPSDFWGQKGYPAPEIHKWKGKYYIFTSFAGDGTYRRCQALVGDTAVGPFKPIKNKPVTPEGWQCLDASFYVDKRGTPWMVFVHEWTQVQDGQFAAVPLSDDLGEAIGPPIILFRASEAPWREDRLGYLPEEDMTWINGYVTDGCYAHRMKNGSLIMLWSNYSRHGYAVGYAKSASGEIQGPWIQEPIALYVMDGGHPMLFRKFDGQLMMTIHAPNHPHTAKRMLLFEMAEQGDELVILNEVTGNWFNVDKGREPKGYYTKDLKVPPAFTDFSHIPGSK